MRAKPKAETASCVHPSLPPSFVRQSKRPIRRKDAASTKFIFFDILI
jgi:hypothetical protein